MGCSIGATTSLWESQVTILTTHTAWASAAAATTTALLLTFFLRRPLELWPLAPILDLLGFVCGLACIAGLGRAQYLYYLGMVIFILPMVSMSIATVLSFAIVLYTWRLHSGRKHADPLKPYLMKREIDVWWVEPEHSSSNRYQPLDQKTSI